MARLTHPNGATVVVADEDVERLLSVGFTGDAKTVKAAKAAAAKAAAAEEQPTDDEGTGA